VKASDLVGQVFGRLTVLARAGSTNGTRRRPLWRCRCACGEEAIVPAASLLAGSTRSCGCLRAEIARALIAVARAQRPKRGPRSLVGEVFGRLTVIARAESTDRAPDHRCGAVAVPAARRRSCRPAPFSRAVRGRADACAPSLRARRLPSYWSGAGNAVRGQPWPFLLQAHLRAEVRASRPATRDRRHRDALPPRLHACSGSASTWSTSRLRGPAAAAGRGHRARSNSGRGGLRTALIAHGLVPVTEGGVYVLVGLGGCLSATP
jgi:hypothetical protein